VLCVVLAVEADMIRNDFAGLALVGLALGALESILCVMFGHSWDERFAYMPCDVPSGVDLGASEGLPFSKWYCYSHFWQVTSALMSFELSSF